MLGSALTLYPPARGGRKNHKAEWQVRFNHFARREFTALMELAKQACAGFKPRRRYDDGARNFAAEVVRASQEGEEDTLSPFTSRKVEFQARLGNLRKAASLLQAPALLDLTQPVLEQLRNKHPSRPDGPLPDFPGRPAGDPSPEERDLMDEVGKQYGQAITTASKGSAPGISGWRYEHFQCLLEPSTGPRPVDDGMQHIYAFFDRILIGDLEDWCRDLLRFGKGFALAKPDGGVRPITVTDTFRRLVTRAVAFKYRTTWCSFLGPNQFAVGTKAGSEKLVHCVSAFINSVEEGTCSALLLDCVNAFNACDRKVILDALHGAYPELEPFFKQFYGGRSPILYRGADGSPHYIWSEEGTMQGDPAGPFLFCLGLKACLDAIEAQLPASAIILSLMDDITVLLDSESALEAFKICQRELKSKFNLELNVMKSKVVPFGDTPAGPQFPEATLDEMRVCRLEGLEIARNGAKLLGCPIGTDAFKQSFFHAKLEEIQGLLHKIGLLHNSQIQILLLRFCAHPRVIYWNRLIDPRTPGKREFLLQHDGQIVRALQSALQIQPSDFQAHTATQLSLPANLGGAGLSSQAGLSEIAFASSIAMCSGAIYERLSRRRFSDWLAEPHRFRDLAIIAHACEDWSSMVAQIIRMDPKQLLMKNRYF